MKMFYTILVEVNTMDITLAIIVLVGVIYFILIIGAILFIKNKKKGFFTQTVDPKPQESMSTHEELKDK